MLERYKTIIDEYKKWHPSMYEKTIECRPSGRSSILATLKDGSKIEYESNGNTVRNVTRMYTCQAADEETWRKDFGHQLRKAISDRGYTQEKLSEVTGISRQMLTRYVRGNSTPSGYILTRLSEALDCDVRELTKFGYIDE